MKKNTSLFREEDGAVEMLQVVTLLGFTAMVTLCLILMNEMIGGKNWGQEEGGWARPLVSKILTDETGGTGNNETIDIDPIDPDDLMETVLHLTESGKPGNTCKDMTNDDEITSDNMITISEKRTSQSPPIYEVSVEMKLERFDWTLGDDENFTWTIEKVSGQMHEKNWKDTSGNFTGSSTVNLQWQRNMFVPFPKQSDFFIRVNDSSSKINRKLKVRVQHVW